MVQWICTECGAMCSADVCCEGETVGRCELCGREYLIESEYRVVSTVCDMSGESI